MDLLGNLCTLTVGLRRIIAINNNQILRTIVVLAREVGLENSLGAIGISLLGIEGGSRHVRNHGVSAAEGVLGVAERVVCGCWLREPDISSVATQVAALESFGHVFLDDDGSSGGIDEP